MNDVKLPKNVVLGIFTARLYGTKHTSNLGDRDKIEQLIFATRSPH